MATDNPEKRKYTKTHNKPKYVFDKLTFAKAVRKEMGYGETQKSLAASLNLTQGRVSSVLSGKKTSFDATVCIAKHFGLKVDDYTV